MDKTFWLQMFNMPNIVFVFAFAVVLVGAIAKSIVKIVQMLIAHHERITMIQHGIHPDYPPEDAKDGNG